MAALHAHPRAHPFQPKRPHRVALRFVPDERTVAQRLRLRVPSRHLGKRCHADPDVGKRLLGRCVSLRRGEQLSDRQRLVEDDRLVGRQQRIAVRLHPILGNLEMPRDLCGRMTLVQYERGGDESVQLGAAGRRKSRARDAPHLIMREQIRSLAAIIRWHEKTALEQTLQPFARIGHFD